MFDGKGQWEKAGVLAGSDPEPTSLRRRRSPGKAPEVYWSGHFYDLSGYAKLNRELLFRVANTIRVALHRGGVCTEVTMVDPLTKARLDAHAGEAVSSTAPLLQVYTPIMETKGRFRICYTMTETQRIHPNFIERLNTLYDEVWLPTEWNLDVAKDSGLKIPGRVMQLGVNPFIYQPTDDVFLPKCSLLTTKRSGVFEIPKGFVFVFSGVPTFRKGFDVLLSAFEDAFADDSEAALLLITTHSRIASTRYDPWKGGSEPAARRARVYEMVGTYTEQELAEVYNGCGAYVCASRGEGFNLPLIEAASCGIPVIAPLAYSHHEFLDEHVAFPFSPDGYEPFEGSHRISHWYKGMPFAHYGKKAHAALVDLMRFVKKNRTNEKVRARGERLMALLHQKFTWDIAGVRATKRLLELQP
jgi:glycosyltransferase involved in cell wall biosynthesis